MEKSLATGGQNQPSAPHHGPDYPELHVVFEFFTDNPQKVMPEDVNSPKKDCPFYDPYWEAIRCMQESDDFMEGTLLRSVDCNPRYPFIHYIIYRGSKTSTSSPAVAAAASVTPSAINTSLSETVRANGNISGGGDGDKLTAGYGETVANRRNTNRTNADRDLVELIKSQGGYRELHTFVDPRIPLLPKRPSNPNTAYIVSAFMTSGNLDNLDRTWSYWSGADYIVENIPPSLKLERVTFHKIINDASTTMTMSNATSTSTGGGTGSGSGSGGGGSGDRKPSGFSYVLLCELSEALADINRAREFIDHLKFRQCGVSSLYVIDHFF